jgi:hypothetical protein
VIKVIIGTNDEFSSEDQMFQKYCLGVDCHWYSYSVCNNINDYPMDMIWKIAKSRLFDDDWSRMDVYYFLVDDETMEMI